MNRVGSDSLLLKKALRPIEINFKWSIKKEVI